MVNSSRKDYFETKLLEEYKRLGSGASFPGNKFKHALVASNPDLVALDEGTRVEVLEGSPDPKGVGFVGDSGKVKVLNGAQPGKVCYCSGEYLKDSLLDKNFLQTEEDKLASQAIFVSKQNGENITDVLKMAGVSIDSDSSITNASVEAPTGGNSGALPSTWLPTFRCGQGDVPVPLGKSIADCSAQFARLRLDCEKVIDTEEEQSYAIRNSMMVIPGWGITKDLRFDFTPAFGTFILKQVTTYKSFQMAPGFKSMIFKQALAGLTNQFGPSTGSGLTAQWNRGAYYITLSIPESDTVGSQDGFDLILHFTKR